MVDPNRDGYVSLQEYMAFMISKETENVQSSEEIEKAFRAITAGDRPYVTKEELYAVSYLFMLYILFLKYYFPLLLCIIKENGQIDRRNEFLQKITFFKFLF